MLKAGDRVRYSQEFLQRYGGRVLEVYRSQRGTIDSCAGPENRVTIGCCRVLWDGHKARQTIYADFLDRIDAADKRKEASDGKASA